MDFCMVAHLFEGSPLVYVAYRSVNVVNAHCHFSEDKFSDKTYSTLEEAMQPGVLIVAIATPVSKRRGVYLDHTGYR